ncbi:MAG: inositol-monophosphatase [Chlamydiota bacterium]
MGAFALAPRSEETFSHLTLIAIEAALQAGDILRTGFGTAFEISSKEGRHNLVTEYDTKAERQVIAFLQQHVPQSQFLAEESGPTGDAATYMWIIDPLDGTVNFAHQIPLFSVSIGLEKKGQLIAGVVYVPMTHELFVAEKGQGAFLNGEPIRVSTVNHLPDSILATGLPYDLEDNPYQCIDHFVDIMRTGAPIRRLGSAAIDMAYTAAGRLDGFFAVGLAPWDCAAGALLIEEAGGAVTTWQGKPFDIHSNLPVAASNSHIHAALVSVLSRNVGHHETT